jgi:tubulin--tyrosine ligase
VSDKEFHRFSSVFRLEDAQVLDGERYQAMGKSLWIVKPGENTNQGCGIQVCKDLPSIREIINNTKINGNKRSYIIQKYIEKPLLYRNRKFDIRCYFLLTS